MVAVFSIPAELARITPSDSPETVQQREEARQKANLQNATFALGCIGVLVGGSLGIGVGIARRSWTRLLAAAIACALVAGLFGALAGLVGQFTYLACKPESQPMPLTGTALIHAVTLATLGLGVGLGLGPFMGRIRAAGECLLAGLAGALLAAMAYPVLTALLTPTAQTEWVVPVEAGSRLLWIGLTSGLLGLIITAFAGKGIHGGRRKPPGEQPPGRGTD